MVKSKPMVALFGGSFDPPHKGHQAIVHAVAALEDIDKVIVMPAFLNPFKKGTLATADKRLAWCQKVCKHPRVHVSDFEISQERAVYTIETLEALKEKYTVKYLVIGADNLAQITQWRDFDKINARITWLVFDRGTKKPDCHALKHCKHLPLDIPVSSTEIRKGQALHHVDKRILDEVKKTITHYKDTHDNQRES